MQAKQYELMFQNENSHWWFLAKRHFVFEMLKNDTNNRVILDVGSGTGGMTLFLKKFGNVTALEPSPYAQKFLKKKKLNVFNCSFERLKTGKKFDLISFFDVLYHRNIINDAAALKKAHTLLKIGGKLLIIDCALPYFHGPHDEKVMAKKRYFLSEMESIINKSGFRIIKSSYIYFFVFPFFAVTRLLQKHFNFESVGGMPKFINRLLLALCGFEAVLLKYFKFPFGSSIIVYAQKK